MMAPAIARGVPAALLVQLVLLLTPAVALAQMADPTRPPPEALLLAGAPTAPSSQPGPQLQSVLVSARPGGRRLAVIDGQTVRLGAKFDGAVLVKVTDTEVVLRRGAALQTLKLYPQAASANASSAPAPAPHPKNPGSE